MAVHGMGHRERARGSCREVGARWWSAVRGGRCRISAVGSSLPPTTTHTHALFPVCPLAQAQSLDRGARGVGGGGSDDIESAEAL